MSLSGDISSLPLNPNIISVSGSFSFDQIAEDPLVAADYYVNSDGKGVYNVTIGAFLPVFTSDPDLDVALMLPISGVAAPDDDSARSITVNYVYGLLSNSPTYELYIIKYHFVVDDYINNPLPVAVYLIGNSPDGGPATKRKTITIVIKT